MEDEFGRFENIVHDIRCTVNSWSNYIVPADTMAATVRMYMQTAAAIPSSRDHSKPFEAAAKPRRRHHSLDGTSLQRHLFPSIQLAQTHRQDIAQLP